MEKDKENKLGVIYWINMAAAMQTLLYMLGNKNIHVHMSSYMDHNAVTFLPDFQSSVSSSYKTYWSLLFWQGCPLWHVQNSVHVMSDVLNLHVLVLHSI